MASIALLQEAYEGILAANNVRNEHCSRKQVKHLIETGIPTVKLHKPKRENESERVTLKHTRYAAVQQIEDTGGSSKDDMHILYNTASVLRKAINKAERWKFVESPTDVQANMCQKSCTIFFRLIIRGLNKTLLTDNKSSEVNKHALSLAQSTVMMSLYSRQVSNTKSHSLKLTHETLQQLAVGVAIRQAIRSKEIVNMLHGFGMSVGYTQPLRMEGRILNAALERVLVNDGVYLPLRCCSREAYILCGGQR